MDYGEIPAYDPSDGFDTQGLPSFKRMDRQAQSAFDISLFEAR